MSFFKPEIFDVVRNQSECAEQDGYLSQDVLAIIYQHKLFKLFVPLAMNGAAKELPEAVKLFEEASYIDGSFGWLVTIGSGGGYFAPIFAPEISQKLFSPNNAVVAGSGHPSGRAQTVEGGYQVSGSWKYCSGADHATIFTANCLLPDGSIRSFIFTPNQVAITKDWDAFGLKATGSHTISVSNVFVPENMTFDIAAGQRHYQHAIYDFPFLQFAEASFAAVNIGICRHFLEEAMMGIQAHKDNGDDKRFTFVNHLIVKQQSLLDDVVSIFYEALEQAWNAQNSGRTDEHLLSALSRTAKNVTAVALGCAQQVYPYLGLAVAMEHSTINRCWRDLHTASQHMLLKSFE